MSVSLTHKVFKTIVKLQSAKKSTEIRQQQLKDVLNLTLNKSDV